MPAFDVLDALVRGGNGVLRTADAVAAGITKPVLGNYVRERGLERVGHGLYLAPDAWKDGMYLLHLRCPQAVFSHDTALFLHDLTDREPLAYTAWRLFWPRSWRRLFPAPQPTPVCGIFMISTFYVSSMAAP